MYPLIRVFLSAPIIGRREYELVAKALDSGYVAPVGPMVDGFEADLTTYTGFTACAAVSSGTAAIHLALRLLGIGPGGRVISPSLTFIGSVTPILFQTAEPLFIDSAAASWLLDPNLLDEELRASQRNGRPIAAVIGVDLYGQPCDTALYGPICAHYGARLIIDAAESLGSFLRGAHTGRGADMVCLSFNGNKIITTSGGGALMSDEPEVVARARNLSQQARLPFAHFEHKEYGYNYRLSNICAAIGRAQIESIEARVARRRQLFDNYHERLERVSGVSFMPEIAGARANRWLTVAVLDPQIGFDPEEVRLALEQENIETRPVWKPMHLQPLFRGAKMRGGSVCEHLFARGLCLPSGAGVDASVVDRIGAVFERVAGNRIRARRPA